MTPKKTDNKVIVNFKAEDVLSKEIQEWKAKAEKWDALENKIAKFYVDENGDELPDDQGGDLGDIGEAAAMAFGFL